MHSTGGPLYLDIDAIVKYIIPYIKALGENG